MCEPNEVEVPKKKRRGRKPRAIQPCNLNGFIGSELRRQREQRDLSYRDVARLAGLQPDQVGSLESGGLLKGLSALVSICDLYGLELGELVRQARESERQVGVG